MTAGDGRRSFRDEAPVRRRTRRSFLRSTPAAPGRVPERRRTNALPRALGRRVNAAVERLAAWGLTPGSTVSLEVTGRRSGLPRRAAVVLVRHAGHAYVVGLGGESEWVRNLRASGGEAVIRHGGSRRVRLDELPVADRPPILHAFLQRRALSRSPARSARLYFGLPPHPPVERLAPLADRYPVFAIHRAGR